MCEYHLTKWTSVQLWQCEAVGDTSLARRMDNSDARNQFLIVNDTARVPGSDRDGYGLC